MLKLSIGGDIMCLQQETEAVRQKFGKLDYSSYLSGLKPLFADCDYAIANLETPIDPTQSETDLAIQFNTPREFAEELRSVGFDFFSTANNHCLDRGVGGLCKTLDVLDELGFEHYGTYRTREDADKIFVKEIKGVKFAIVCSTFGTNSQLNGVMLPPDEEWRIDLLRKQMKLRKLPQMADVSDGNFRTYIADEVSSAAISNSVNLLYMNRVLDKIKMAKAKADIVIAMPHVGGQYNPGPAAYTTWVVEQLRLAGADIIIAGHSHTPHRCEIKDGCFIAYSLGNLAFTPGVGWYVPNVLAEYGVVLHLMVDEESKRFSSVKFDIVKNVVDEDGLTHVLPVDEIMQKLKNAPAKDRHEMEVEEIVHRLGCRKLGVQREYSIDAN
ncbi:MAG: CapA family protein [Kiritimatiellae bacterium]|nr:CapA family protein [Kiritimatiellia bacterium]